MLLLAIFLFLTGCATTIIVPPIVVGVPRARIHYYGPVQCQSGTVVFVYPASRGYICHPCR